MLSGVAAGVSKTFAAPIERVKLLVQNQDEMIKQGRLEISPMSRDTSPTQALNFAFKDSIKAVFKTPKDAPSYMKFGTNIASGGAAGTMSLLFVYSLDYARTRFVLEDTNF